MVGGWWGFQSHFRVQPDYSVEVVLCYCWGCDNKPHLKLMVNKEIPGVFNGLSNKKLNFRTVKSSFLVYHIEEVCYIRINHIRGFTL